MTTLLTRAAARCRRLMACFLISMTSVSANGAAQDFDPFGVPDNFQGRTNHPPIEHAVWSADFPVSSAGQNTFLWDALDSKVTLEFSKTTLPKVSAVLEANLRVPIIVQDSALQDAGIDRDTEIEFAIRNSRLKNALSLLLSKYDLTWSIRDETLVITTPNESESSLETRVYPVRDLVEFDPDGDSFDDDDSLIDVITLSISPNSWTDAGGIGSIRHFGNAKSLVISHTTPVQEQVATLLASLRRSKRSQDLSRGPLERTVYFSIQIENEIDRMSTAKHRPPARHPHSAWQIPRTH